MASRGRRTIKATLLAGRGVVRCAVISLKVVGVAIMMLFCVSWISPDTVRPVLGVAETAILANRGITPAGTASTTKIAIICDPAWRTIRLDRLPKSQAAVARWLGTHYHVDPEAVATLVVEAYQLGQRYKLPPRLILAMVAVESNFHPYIESSAGAQGLMQVMSQIHAKLYAPYGGQQAAINPLVNMRVGVEILRESIRLRGGSLNDGLRFYSGGKGEVADNYVARVRAMQNLLDAVSLGRGDVSK